MEPIKTYTLERLNENTVNVLIISTIELNGKTYEIEKSRTCYGNSPIGRSQVNEQLPEQYAKAIFEIWGENLTMVDSVPPVEVPPQKMKNNTQEQKEEFKC